MEKEIGTEVILFRFDAVNTLFAIFMGELHVFVKLIFPRRSLSVNNHFRNSSFNN
jgi:hypothetical protein